MLAKFRALVTSKKGNPNQRTSRRSRESKSAAGGDSNKKSSATSREVPVSSPWMANFEGFRHMLKDLSKRLDAIRENPEETYLINSELTFRLLGVLENIAEATEKNTIALQKLAGNTTQIQHTEREKLRKRRAREVLAVLERCGPLTYEELRRELKPIISYKRVTALVSEMIRDGVALDREGKPVRVSLGNPLTGSN
jgi:hypothetical protein